MHRNKHREAAKLRRQRKMAQMKEQNKTPRRKLSKMERANLSEADFITLIIRMLRELLEFGGKKKKGRNEGYTK